MYVRLSTRWQHVREAYVYIKSKGLSRGAAPFQGYTHADREMTIGTIVTQERTKKIKRKYRSCLIIITILN